MKETRKFTIGSEWLYYKIYIGEYYSDHILVDTIYPIVNKLINKKLIDKFFFIRYYDENGHHLRVRFHLTNIDFIGYIISIIYHETNRTSSITKIQIDTYERELERYYDECINYTETIFYYDSIATLEMISKMNDYDENFKWLYSIYSMDSMMNIFGLNLNNKIELSNSCNTSFIDEFSIDKNFIAQLDKKYRNNKSLIYDTLINKNMVISDIVAIRNNNIIENVKEINNKLSFSNKLNLLISLIHMSCNRVFKNSQRKHEFVLYHFLWKYYRGELGKQKHNKL